MAVRRWRKDFTWDVGCGVLSPEARSIRGCESAKICLVQTKRHSGCSHARLWLQYFKKEDEGQGDDVRRSACLVDVSESY